MGKSSLINALTDRKALARVSNTPGRTQQINFFQLKDALILADLPGYGYAKASKTEIRRWTRLIFDYLRGRPSLRRVCLLIDARHGLKSKDIEVMKDLDEAAVSYQIVFTKCDKVKPAALENTKNTPSSSQSMSPHLMIIRTSSTKKKALKPCAPNWQ